MDESIEAFLKRNESRVNKYLSYFIFALIPFIPILILLNRVGLFPQLNVGFLLFSWLLLTAFSIHYFFFGKREIMESARKYVLLCFLLVIVFLISITKGINVYLCFCSLVLISCMYFNLYFTGSVALITYVALVVSIILREKNLLEGYYIGPKENWTISCIIGSSMEYFCYVTLCMFFTKIIREILISIYNHKKVIVDTQDSMIEGFANMIEAKDSNTGGHIRRTSQYVKLISMKLMEKGLYPDQVNPRTIEIMVRSAPFHDLGKISIPEEILNKPDRLSPEEFEIIKSHPTEGAEFIMNKFGVLDDEELINTARDMALYHHEHVDGSGYPKGLKGEEIPVCSRIMAVADILDALLSKRSYKVSYSVGKSLEIMKGMAGKTLDPVVVYALLAVEKEIKIISEGGVIDYGK